MGPKVEAEAEAEAEPPRKVKKPLTEEEKRMKAEYAALQAEEMRKKKIRDRRAAIKQHMVEEEKRSKWGMLQIHKEWRKIMRQAAVKEMRTDIEWISAKHIHEVERKDQNIDWCRRTSEEAELQHRAALSKHLSMLDALLDLHYLRMKRMEDDFQGHLHNLDHSFTHERNLMNQNHTAQKKEMTDMMAAMKSGFDEEVNEKRQEFETSREELKNKNMEEYNVLRISLESKIEELERHIEKTHTTYITNTEMMASSFKALSAKDAMTSKLIEQRMRKLVKLHENLATMRASMTTKSKQWEARNRALCEEKERLNKHYQILKRSLNKEHEAQHQKLKKISKDVGEATEVLKKRLVGVQRLQKLAALIKRLETEHEQIFPFNPLYVASVPMAPVERLDEEIASAAEAEELPCKVHNIEKWRHPSSLNTVPDNVVYGEPTPGQVAPKVDERFMVDMHVLIPSQHPKEEAPLAKGPTFRWASQAVDNNGSEVDELDYLQNFQKRYNKVMLDKLAIELERKKLTAENQQLRAAMGGYLDGLTLSEQAKSEYNALMMVGRCKMASPPPPAVKAVVETSKQKTKKS